MKINLMRETARSGFLVDNDAENLLIEELNARGIKTSRGGEWHKTTVARVLVLCWRCPLTLAAEPVDRAPLRSRW